MKIHCTRPSCPRPDNFFTDLDPDTTLKTVQQKFCTTCGMPLILDGRYLPERLLGKGGFGAAFLACDRRSPTLRKRVVKQFQPAADLSPQQLTLAQNLFEREAIVLDRIGNQHPQIPNLLAYFPLEAPGWQSSKPQQFFYIVQEYIPGQDLEAELAAKGKFSEAEVEEVLEEILKILQFVHDQEVIHRDIKPSNIMRHRNGRLYLLDFGAVKEVTQGAGGGGKSTGIYSLGFAPPEQMRGKSVFPSTDLYALAVTCLMLLTAKDPQELYDSFSDRWNWRNETQVSDALADILDRMLMPTPSDRFGSAEEVLRSIHPAASPPPPPPPIPSPTPTPPVVQTPPTPPPPPAKQRSFSTIEILGGAAFTGFEAGVLVMGLSTLLNSIPLVALITGGVVGGLIFAQFRHWIEKWDRVILAVISLALLLLIPAFRANLTLPFLIIVPLVAALGFVAVTALFRLVYIILNRVL